MSRAPAEILDDLVDLSRKVEALKAALYLTELEREQLLVELRSSGWTPPPAEPA